MRRIFILIAFLLGLPYAQAQSSVGSLTGYCNQGSTSAVTQGLNSVNKLQGIIPSCQVTVYLTGTQAKATLFADPAGTIPLTNPFTASTTGQWLAFASNTQQYDVVANGGIPPNNYVGPVALQTGVGASGAFGKYLPLAGGTLSGALFGPNINGELYPAQCGSATPAAWCSGSTPDAWIRAACNALPANGGVINFLGMVGNIANQVTCSTNTKQVIFLADNTSSELTITENDGLTVFPLDNTSAIIGIPGGQCQNNNGFKLAPTANITSLFGSAHTDGNQENFTVSGVCMHGYPGATVSKAMIYPSHVFTNTTITDNNVLQCPGDCILSENVGGSEIITGNEFDATEGNPSIIGGAVEIMAAGVNGCGTSNVFLGYGDAEHSNGKPEINIHGDGAGALVCWVHVTNMYLEKSAVGTFNTAGINISDCWGCSVTDTQILGGDGVHNTGAGIVIGYTANSSWTQQVRLQNIDVGTGAYANTLIDTSLGGITLNSFNTPFIDQYTANPGYEKPFPPAPTTLQSVGADILGGIGSFSTGSANFGTGFGSAGCQAGAGTTCNYTRGTSTFPPNYSYSQQVQLVTNTNPGGVNGIESTAKYAFTAGQTYLASFWAKGDGVFAGYPLFYLGDFVGNNYCQSTSPLTFQSSWTLYTFYCTPTVTSSSNVTLGSETPANLTGSFWVGGFTFSPIQPLPPGQLIQSITPYGIGPATAAQQTITINGTACQLQGNCTVGTPSGVPTINGSPGPVVFSFSAGAGGCTVSGGTQTCTVSGSGSGGGSVSNFIAAPASWPSWLTPSVTTSTTTPTLSVSSSGIPNGALQNSAVGIGTTNLTLGSTVSSVAGLTVNGVTLSSTGSSSTYLNQAGAYTTPTFASEFPITIGGTAINKNSTTTSINNLTLTGSTVNGVTLSNTGSATNCLSQAGTYVACGGGGGGGTTTNPITFTNTGGAAAGSTFNGSAALTVSPVTIGAAPLASPTFTGTATTPALTISGITGSTQCLQINSTGVVSGSGAACGGSGSGAVNSVSNSDGSLNIPTTTGTVVASLNPAHSNTWTAQQIVSAAGAASAPGLLISGTPYTSGTSTTNTPQLYVATTGASAAGNLSGNGTMFGVNAPSGFTGNLMDFYVNGVTSLMSLSYTGALTTYGAISSRGANTLQTAVTTTVPLTVQNTMSAAADLTDWKSNGSIVASINNLGALTTTNIIDSALTAGTAPVCPNGTGGALTTSGCNLGTQTICSGTITMPTAAIASGANSTTVAQTCTGLASTDNISLDFNSNPQGITGFVASSSGTLTIYKYPTANTINVYYQNNTSSSITPGAVTLNYRVTR